MKNRLFFYLLIFFPLSIFSQKPENQVVGNYSLEGVREVASGFQVNADHTFQFFFSYGALDRVGGGTWAIEGDSVVFNSKIKTTQDFKLTKSEKRNKAGTYIKITSPNAYLNQNVYAKIISDKYSDLLKADNNGLIFFNEKSVKYINLMLQFCPEKIAVFEVADKSHNYFEFSMLESIFEIDFKNLKLKIEPDKLRGKLTMLDEKELDFVKEK